MGLEEGEDRRDTYQRLRAHLPASSRHYWDAHTDDLTRGLLRSGRTEQMFGEFVRAWPQVHSPEVLDRLFSFRDDVAAQASYFDDVVATPAFREAFANHHSLERRIQARLVIPIMAECFAGREDEFDKMWWNNFRRSCTTRPLHDNFYIRFFLTGTYSIDCRPPYLQPETYPVLQRGAERVTCLNGPIEAALADDATAFSKAHLSNILVNLDQQTQQAITSSLAAHLRIGGRLCYFGHHVDTQGEHLRSHDELSPRLAARDRVPWYGELHIEERVA
jgi:S-adenosylmethionine-diacylglycerol 3-amino-3-carboxypropyl transferase